MCKECIIKLISFNEFKIQCHKSDNYLKLCAPIEFRKKNSSTLNGLLNNNIKLEYEEESSNVEENICYWYKGVKTEDELDDKESLSSLINQSNNASLNINVSSKKKFKNANKEEFREDKQKRLNRERVQRWRKRQPQDTLERLRQSTAERIAKIRSHINIKQKKSTESVCNICYEIQSTKEELKLHKCLHYSYTCKFCQIRFQNLSSLRKHECMNIKHEAEYQNENKETTKPSDAKDDFDYLKVLVCHMCSSEFKHSRSLRHHIRSHKGEKPALCTQCGKGFREDRGLLNHVRAVHTGEKRFKCSFCPKAFPVSGKRRQHERIHTGEKPYKCNVCNRLFSHKTTLNVHLRRHTGEDKFKCTVEGCNQGFIAFSTFQRHIRAHKGERPYSCSHCDKTYLSSQNLKSHVKAVHTKVRDEVCNICGKGFTERSVLNRHLRKIHNLEPIKTKFRPVYDISSETSLDINHCISNNAAPAAVVTK